jgi:hypothetical protein
VEGIDTLSDKDFEERKKRIIEEGKVREDAVKKGKIKESNPK